MCFVLLFTKFTKSEKKTIILSIVRQEKNQRDGTSTRSPSLQSQKSEKQADPRKALALGHGSCPPPTTSNREADSPVSEILWGHWLQGHWLWGAEKNKGLFISDVSQSFHTAFPRQPTWNYHSPDQHLSHTATECRPQMLWASTVCPQPPWLPLHLLGAICSLPLVCYHLFQGSWVRNWSYGWGLIGSQKLWGIMSVHRYSISLKRNSLALCLFSKASLISQIRSDYFIRS